jgi:sugar lactone lactonase YvrE
VRVVVTLALVLGLASPAQAAGFFQSAWGEDVIAGNVSVGPEVCTVSANCKEGVSSGEGGAFGAPSAVASDGAGNVYVLEEAGNRVQKFSSAGAFQRMWGKDVIRSGAASDTGTGFEICAVAADCQQGSQGSLGGELSHPEGIAVDSAGNVYVADTDNNRIQEYTAAGAFIRAFGLDVDSTQSGAFEICTVAGNCKAGGASPGGAGTIFLPAAIAVDSDGAIYIASGLRRVDKFTTTGGVLAFDRTWGADVDSSGGTGFEVCTVPARCQTGTVGTGLGGEFGLPVGIAVAAGGVYVFGGNRFRVDKFTTSGDFVRAWGKDVVSGGGTGFEVCTVAASCKTGVTGSAGGEFRSPNDLVAPASDAVAVDPAGTTVYVADRENDRLQVFGSDGHFEGAWGLNVDSTSFSLAPQICTVASNCTAASVVSPLPGGAMSRPTGVAVDATGAIYEVDQTAARIQRFVAGAPDTPVVAATNYGPSPANDNHPLVTGTATPGSTVNLYDNAGCTGAPIGTGTAAAFASGGIAATVPDDSITRIHAEATNGAGSSPCSTTSASYEEISTLRWHVHFDAARASVSEGAGSITVTISRSGVSDGTASVHYATADGTAGPADYGTVSGTLTFSPGQASKSVGIPIVNDQRHEPDETFTIALSNPGLGTDTDAPASETITIRDDDPFDTPDTTITSGPDGVSWTTIPTFTFTSDDPSATFRCRVDGGAEVVCKSPYTIPAVKESGAHSITVTAVNSAGVADPSPARRTFRVGDTETHKLSCGLHAFSIDPKANSGYNGCSLEPAGHACSGIFAACQSVVPACPLGAKCTYQVTANGADQDRHVTYITNGYVVARVTPEIRANHGFAYGLAGMIAFAACFHAEDSSSAVCPQTGTAASTIGDGTAPSFLCPTANSPNYSGGIPPSLGPDAARFIRCDFTMTIAAAPTLITTPSTSADGFVTYAPGPGTVTAAPAGASAKAASIARVQTKGLFRKTTKTVKRTGPVRFKLTLSKSAQATLKKKQRLVLTVKLTFKPRKGKTVTRTHKVTLRKLPKLKQTRPR